MARTRATRKVDRRNRALNSESFRSLSYGRANLYFISVIRVASKPGARATTIAVVIPTFNHAAFLADAIQSARDQSRPPDEIIVVDDGSEDDPALVVRQFPNVRFIRRDNGGLSAARNTGLAATDADKVVFLDADDLLHRVAIEAALQAFERTPRAVFVYGAHRRVDSVGNVLVPHRYAAIGTQPYLDFLRCNMIGMHATVVYDRRQLAASGGFDESLRRCEDYDVYLRLAQAGEVASHDTVVADYRWHGSNMSSDSSDMLDWVLKVHAKQWRKASERPDTHAAWKHGRKIWKDHYAEETLNNLGGKRPAELLFGVAAALKASPVFTTRQAARKVASGLLRRAKAFSSNWPPAVGKVDFGDFGGTDPVSRDFGFDRGTPIDRYYIEKFLAEQANLVRGRVLEVGDASYSKRFGGNAVTQQDVLHVTAGAKGATIIGDLVDPRVLPEAAFDCMVLTQTLHLIYDMHVALRHIHRALRPGGVVLLTVPGITPLDRGEWSETWSWSLTPYSARRLFAECFAPHETLVSAYGNVFAATAFLQGVALEEVDTSKLDELDSAYPVIVAVRARKSMG
jgi:glycosyltransferase involved in cell wall biosynthesis/SAM-dependent methyltransferase